MLEYLRRIDAAISSDWSTRVAALFGDKVCVNSPVAADGAQLADPIEERRPEPLPVERLRDGEGAIA